MALIQSFPLNRCPHCRIDKPNLSLLNQVQTQDSEGTNSREWGFYKCARCGGIVTAWAPSVANRLLRPGQWFPGEKQIDDSIPERARAYLDQAISSIHAPSGAVMLAATSVDAMLKSKGYKDGSLYSRIDKAKEDHLITPEMADWAHEVRLDANDQRHADEEAPLPKQDDAEKVIEFARALAQFLFVLPARIQRGRAHASGSITVSGQATATLTPQA
jgi:Domain of unknown function (DUF4145)